MADGCRSDDEIGCLFGSLSRDCEPLADHIGIMNASEQMCPFGHVAVLASYALFRIGAVEPFTVGVLQWFAVDRPDRVELMTGGTEPTVAHKRLGPYALMDSFPGSGRCGGWGVQYAVTKMAAGTENTVPGQETGLVSLHVRGQSLEIALQQGLLLFGHRRVAVETADGVCFGIIYDLTEQTRRECLGMPAAGPIGVFFDMTGAACFGCRWRRCL